METKPQPFNVSEIAFDEANSSPVEDPKPKRDAGLSREEEAKLALEHTAISPLVARCLCALFLSTIVLVPLVQMVAKLRAHESVLPALSRDTAIPQASDLKHFENQLESDSVVGNNVLPHVQNALAHLGVGTENAYLGRDGWLAYRPDFNYVTGHGFLEPGQLRRRSREMEDGVAVQSDPVGAILQFRDQLAKRRIQLILLPTPLKPMLEPQHFSSGYNTLSAPLQNPSYRDFLRKMQENKVMVCDPTTALFSTAQRNGDPLFLQADTHWTPAAMQATADVINGFIERFSPIPPGQTLYGKRPTSVSAQGDIALMLKLPDSQSQKMYPAQKVDLDQILAPDGQPWRASSTADVLLLGDSFTNIYSREGMGWGSGAGLAEQLSYRLHRPLDVIGINAGGSFATRRRLHDELLRDPNRLKNTRIVVWQFAMRDLQSGNWQSIELPSPAPNSIRTTPDVVALKSTPTPVLQPSSPAVIARFRRAITQKVAEVDQQQGDKNLAPILDGSRGWMYYLSDARCVTSHGFLLLGHNPQVDALVDFKRQLAQRGIKLLVMPVPAKATIYPEMLGLGNIAVPQAPQNPSFDAYKQALQAQGIEVFDPTESLLEEKQRIHAPLYMPTDSHWTFEGMESTASRLAAQIEPELSEIPPVGYVRKPVQVANITDISYMLAQQPGSPQAMLLQQTIQQVQTPSGEIWKAAPDADVLVMGDSYVNIYSHGGDWGRGAGFAEQLSYDLQRPIDLIAMDSGGINDTRRSLQQDMQEGHDRLAGKKIVIYEIGSRYLLRRDWETIKLPVVGQKPPGATQPTSAPTSSMTVRATIKARSAVPDAAMTPYPDLVMSLRLTNVQVQRQAQQANAHPQDLLVYTFALRKARPTNAADWKVGQTVTLDLTPWHSVEDEYGSYNRTELDGDSNASLDDYWGVEGK